MSSPYFDPQEPGAEPEDYVKELQGDLAAARSWRVFAWADGVAQWAWWKDGVQYVGTCGTTLEDALKLNPYKEETE